MSQYAEKSGEGRIMLPLCNRIVTTEISNDYTLPDYQPEIRRILTLRENIMPPAKYINGDSVELDGNIDYTLIYVGEDGEIYSAPLSAEYSFNMPFDAPRGLDRSEGFTVLSNTFAESSSARATAPRKLNVKCRISCHASLWGGVHYGEEMQGEFTPDRLHRLCRDGSFASVCVSASEPIELTDSYDAPEDIRVINADADIIISDVSDRAGGISVNGEVVLSLLCADEENNFSKIARKLPFDEMIESDRNFSAVLARQIKGCVSNINISFEEGKINSEVGIILEVCESGNEPFSYTEDIYSTEKHCECRREEISVPTVKKNIFGNLSQSERISLVDANISEGSEIIDVFGKACVTGVDNTDGKSILTGDSRYSLICKREEDIYPVELRVPFRYECDSNIPNKADLRRDDINISCTLDGRKARIDGDMLMLDAEIRFSGLAFEESDISKVCEIVAGDEIEKQGADIIVCYPTSDESVWSIAKKYLVPPSKVSGDPATDRYCIIQM
jgi:hypothetical protein